MQKYYMLFRDNVVYIKTDVNDKVVEYSLDNSIIYPNVPFYCSIFNNKKIINELKLLVRNTLNSGSKFKQILVSKRVFILMPDDVTDETEKERFAFDELARKIFGAKEVILGSELAFVTSLEENNFICISRTCRKMILTYIKNRTIYKQKFMEDRDYTSNELLIAARNLEDGFDMIPNIYLNGTHLSHYSNIGTVVDIPQLFKNIIIVSDLFEL